MVVTVDDADIKGRAAVGEDGSEGANMMGRGGGVLAAGERRHRAVEVARSGATWWQRTTSVRVRL